MTDHSGRLSSDPSSAPPQINTAPLPPGTGREAPEDVKVMLTPLLVTLGVIAIIVGIGAGLLMSTATFFK